MGKYILDEHRIDLDADVSALVFESGSGREARIYYVDDDGVDRIVPIPCDSAFSIAFGLGWLSEKDIRVIEHHVMDMPTGLGDVYVSANGYIMGWKESDD